MFKSRLLKLSGAFAVCMLIAAWVGWSFYQSRYPSWYEEVRLLDGRIITVHQKREVYENYGTNQSWVEIDLPELGGKQVWHSYLMPQRVDVFGGNVYVFGASRGIRQNQFYSYPKNFLVGFKWNGSIFERIPFLSIPEVIRREENIYPCIPDTGLLSALKIGLKDKTWCEIRGDKWKFGKVINLDDYQKLALFYAALDGTTPKSE